MEDILYIDRPSVPATQQNIIKIEGILEHSIPVEVSELNSEYCGYAVEVKDADGEIDGTLVYFLGLTYEQLTAPEGVDDLLELSTLEDEYLGADATEDTEGEEDTEDAADAAGFEYEEFPSLDEAIAAYEADNTIINLERELAEARQRVQKLQDAISEIEEGR